MYNTPFMEDPRITGARRSRWHPISYTPRSTSKAVSHPTYISQLRSDHSDHHSPTKIDRLRHTVRTEYPAVCTTGPDTYSDLYFRIRSSGLQVEQSSSGSFLEGHHRLTNLTGRSCCRLLQWGKEGEHGLTPQHHFSNTRATREKGVDIRKGLEIEIMIVPHCRFRCCGTWLRHSPGMS